MFPQATFHVKNIAFNFVFSLSVALPFFTSMHMSDATMVN